MIDTRLDKDLISDPSIYTMLIRVVRETVDVVIFSPMADNSLIYRSFKSQDDAAETASKLEEVVYDNPLMLADFRRVVILTTGTEYILIPSELTDTDRAAGEQTFKIFYPDWDGLIETSATPLHNATIVYGIARRTASFISRTYPNATVMPHVLPLMRYFSSRSGRSNSPRLLVNLRPGQADLIATSGNNLRQAVTIGFKCTADLVYHILSSVQANGLDPHSDSIMLAGDRELRDELTSTLRNYHARVMPVIFPPEMFKAGREAMNAPFDLIVTPLV